MVGVCCVAFIVALKQMALQQLAWPGLTLPSLLLMVCTARYMTAACPTTCSGIWQRSAPATDAAETATAAAAATQPSLHRRLQHRHDCGAPCGVWPWLWPLPAQPGTIAASASLSGREGRALKGLLLSWSRSSAMASQKQKQRTSMLTLAACLPNPPPPPWRHIWQRQHWRRHSMPQSQSRKLPA